MICCCMATAVDFMVIASPSSAYDSRYGPIGQNYTRAQPTSTFRVVGFCLVALILVPDRFGQ